jgi:DNA-binding winged helix-turn-helix (wHTH) protein
LFRAGNKHPKLVVSYAFVPAQHESGNRVASINQKFPQGIVQGMNANDSEIRQPETTESAPIAPAFPTRYLRFGGFQLDLQREELSKAGDRIRLQGKVYQTLLILLSRAGNVVTRDEVRKHLWPESPQVNFDANVNTTMNKLRQALGDSPENPAYIETIPRRGYCFLLDVEFASSPMPVSVKAAETPAGSAVNAAQAADTQHWEPHVLPVGLRIAILVLAGMIVGAMLVLAWFSYSRSHKALNSGARSPELQTEFRSDVEG